MYKLGLYRTFPLAHQFVRQMLLEIFMYVLIDLSWRGIILELQQILTQEKPATSCFF